MLLTKSRRIKRLKYGKENMTKIVFFILISVFFANSCSGKDVFKVVYVEKEISGDFILYRAVNSSLDTLNILAKKNVKLKLNTKYKKIDVGDSCMISIFKYKKFPLTHVFGLSRNTAFSVNGVVIYSNVPNERVEIYGTNDIVNGYLVNDSGE